MCATAAGATMTVVDCRVLVVDDHAEFRAVARELLVSEGFEVVGEASDGAGAISTVRRLRPDLVLLDVALPDMDGFSVVDRLVREIERAPEVVLVSSRSASAYRRRLAATPARGFISKSDLTGPAIRLLLGPD
jgi:DNA-binding NarL/FixJ family response regulator